MYLIWKAARGIKGGGPDEVGTVLLDGNYFLVHTAGLACPLHPRSYEKLIESVTSDIAFLSDNNIIDYSLTIGYAPENKNIVTLYPITP